MKQIEVVAAIIRNVAQSESRGSSLALPSQSNVTERKGNKIFATQRGYGEWKAAGKREQSQTRLSYAEREQARLEGKAGWEFPGGKMEAGETPEEALKREIREELSTEISVDEFLCTVEYDYPAFHLTMHCYLCSLLTEALHLNEHEAARWLAKDELDSVEWLPADWDVVRDLKKSLSDV